MMVGSKTVRLCLVWNVFCKLTGFAALLDGRCEKELGVKGDSKVCDLCLLVAASINSCHQELQEEQACRGRKELGALGTHVQVLSRQLAMQGSRSQKN